MDASFSTSAELEIHEFDLGDREGAGISKLGSVSSNSRFNRLAWSGFSGGAASADGVIIGGMEDGSVGFWNASRMIAGEAECLIELKAGAHQGPVRGLQVNPLTPNLAASGSINADILLWDLQSLQSYPPTGTKSNRLEDITDLAWNCQVSHILATASNSGYTAIWDLKTRKEVIQLCLPGGRKSVSAIAWNPDTPTHILTASDDDQSPVIYSWDLRNSHAPSMTLTGHTKGILSMSWCPKDSELLLSSGKDNRVLCWNPKNGQLVSEVSHSSNWIFDTQWCPRNPDIFSSASFDGMVLINSFQALTSGHAATSAPAPSTDLFGAPIPASTPQAEKGSAGPRQIPKWLRRPIGASFGFGGRLVTFSETSGRRVTVSSVAMGGQEKGEAVLLDEALKQNSLGSFCSGKLSHPISSLHERDPEAVFWSVVKVLVEAEPQKNLLSLLGFDRAKFEAQVQSLGLKDVEESLHDLNIGAVDDAPASNGSASPISFGDSSSVFDELQQTSGLSSRSGRRPSAPFALFGTEASPTDRAITQAIILGDFSAAVDICIKSGRLSDALLVAICGGPELVARTQEIYLQRVRYPYLRVVSAIIKKDLSDVVGNADVSNWEELLGLICSFAQPSEFGRHCAALAERLEAAAQHQGRNSLGLPAVLCWMAAGRATEAARALLRMEEAPKAYTYASYSVWLESVVSKLRGLERAAAAFQATAVDLPAVVPEVAQRFLEYAVLMADRGSLDIATRYFVPSSAGELAAGFGDRLYGATRAIAPGMAKVEAPFEAVAVLPEGNAPGGSAPSVLPAATHQPPQGPVQHSWAPPAAAPRQQQQPSFGGWNPPAAVAAPQAPAQQFPPSSSFGGPSFPPAPAAFPSAPASSFPPAPASSFPPAPTASFPPVPAASFPPAPPAVAFPPAPISSFPPAPSTSFPSAPVTPAFPNPNPNVSFPPAPNASFPPAPTAQAFPPASTAQAFPPAGQSSFSQFQPHQPMMTSPTDMTGHPGQMASSFTAPQLPRTPSFGTNPSQPPQAPFIPQPAPVMMASPTAIKAPSLEQIRKPVGGFNDAPIIEPKTPLAASAPIAPPTFTPASPPAATAPMLSSQMYQQQPQQATPLQQQPQQPLSPRALGPVDPNKIPAASQPIYQAFSSLAAFCQSRALPVQRRILEDSTKRLAMLFHQLAGDAQPSPLSPHVHSELLRMAQFIGQRQYVQALELHVPLMTAHFHEVGQWILAVKRLIEVAKTCPPS